MNFNMMQTRAISDLAIKILYILAVNNRAMNIAELSMWANRTDDEPIRKECNILAQMGYVEIAARERNEKFYSLPSGAQALLPGFAQILPAPVENPVGGKPETGKALVIDGVEIFENIPENWAENAKNDTFAGRIAPVGGKPETDLGSIIDDDDELINLNTTVNHQSEPEKKNQKLPALKVILENMHLVFGDALDEADLPPGTTAEKLLAWICKVNADMVKGGKIYNPLGVICARLKTARPRRILHLEQLPDDFLAAIGMSVEREKSGPDYSAEALARALEESRLENAREAERMQALEQHIAREVSSTVAAAWMTALDVLRESFPGSSFDTWIADTRVVGMDGKTLIVGARNEYAVKWVAEKALAQLESELRGALGEAATIRLVVLSEYLEGQI